MSKDLRFRRLRLKNWKNFLVANVAIRDRVFLVGANASGKSNFLDAFRFLRDIAMPKTRPENAAQLALFGDA